MRTPPISAPTRKTTPAAAHAGACLFSAVRSLVPRPHHHHAPARMGVPAKVSSTAAREGRDTARRPLSYPYTPPHHAQDASGHRGLSRGARPGLDKSLSLSALVGFCTQVRCSVAGSMASTTEAAGRAGAAAGPRPSLGSEDLKKPSNYRCVCVARAVWVSLRRLWGRVRGGGRRPDRLGYRPVAELLQSGVMSDGCIVGGLCGTGGHGAGSNPSWGDRQGRHSVDRGADRPASVGWDVELIGPTETRKTTR